MKRLITLSIVVFAVFVVVPLFSANAQVKRVAILPFKNIKGDMRLNTYSYQLQDSLAKVFVEKDSKEQYFRIVPIDSIETLLATMNLNPNNPQYQSDVWKAVKQLNAKYIISGSFDVEAQRIVVNAYIYDVKTKLSNRDCQARDIFKKEENIMEAVPVILDAILPALIPAK